MDTRIVITGGAGLLGQNLIQRLAARGFSNLAAIDKHHANVEVLRAHNPELIICEADLAEDGAWADVLAGCEVLVIGHAQIGGVDPAEFVRNNVAATERLLDAATRHGVRYIVHISSSVVNSMAVDNYTETKKAQEALFKAVTIPHIVLRPTLMFGWFDRKHLGWLARFMQKAPVFPIPGSGQYLRQPLYIGDFCDIIISAIESRRTGTFDISGQQRIDYIDLIRALKRATGSKARIQRIPYRAFWALLALYARVDRNPPFTTKQLEALITPDVFDVIDWPAYSASAPPRSKRRWRRRSGIRYIRGSLSPSEGSGMEEVLQADAPSEAKRFVSFRRHRRDRRGGEYRRALGAVDAHRLRACRRAGLFGGDDGGVRAGTAIRLLRQRTRGGDRIWAVRPGQPRLLPAGLDRQRRAGARVVFPSAHFDWHADDLAHVIGVASPILLSYYLHKHFSFGRR